jgi:predicted lactoylglutathione lyase
MKPPRIRQWVRANICVRNLDRSVPFYEMVGFEKFADQIFDKGSGVCAASASRPTAASVRCS